MSRRPSPSLVVSIIALVFATAGTSIAAVNFARNAGAVDHKSAVGAASSTHSAAGKLVAASSSGKIPARFLDLSGVVGGGKNTFAQGIDVTDNSTSTPAQIGGIPGTALVTATCGDQSAKVGTEDPTMTVTFSNVSTQAINLERSVSNGAPVVTSVAPNTSSAFTINNSNAFHMYMQAGAIHYTLDGVVRQVGANTAAASCQIYGYGVAL